ncbi:MAG: hypothetical protein JWP49_1651, partial [Phenylobacterium sp.]|nr:hypothetical protein [Phenylobacterium sp.]
MDFGTSEEGTAEAREPRPTAEAEPAPPLQPPPASA